jgi:hypothetical protein
LSKRWSGLRVLLIALFSLCGIPSRTPWPSPPPRNQTSMQKTTGARDLAIDVREWRRRHLLQAGQQFSCSWTRNGEPSGSIGVRTEADAVILIFQWHGLQSEKWKSVEQRVPLVWTRCHLGGKRPWFICVGLRGRPRCGRRVAMLYAGDPDFACRGCYSLAYASQSESPRANSTT